MFNKTGMNASNIRDVLESCGSKLSGLHHFDSMALIHSVKKQAKNRKVGCELMRHQSLL